MSSVYLHKLTQGRRKVCKSGRASSNVVGIIYPPLEKRQLICQNLKGGEGGGEITPCPALPAPVPTALIVQPR